MYKMVIIDLDGTLLNDQKEISNEDAYIINRAYSEKGTICVIATGRSYICAKYLADIVGEGLSQYIIASTGSEIRDIKNNICLNKQCISNENTIKIIECVQKYNFRCNVDISSKVISNSRLVNQEILDKITSMSNYEILKEIYKYIVKTIKYDYEDLEKRNIYMMEGNSITAYQNEYKDINSSYKALIEKKAVCEGYANALKFLANLRNIEVENITCFLNENKKSFDFYNHTASRVKINNQWLYCDSQIETNPDELKYFLLTESEFEKTHKLQHEKQKRIGEKK
jgi:hydroxymethylpyrimidine pyrophosphatase-like HAD family hydrolase